MKFQENKQHLFHHYHQKTIPQLQHELRTLKQRQRHYTKLSSKVKDLEEKSKKLKQTTSLLQLSDEDQTAHIDQLKRDIEGTLLQIKRIEDDNKLIKQQSKSLENQLRGLEQVHNTFCLDNKAKRQRIQLKDESLVSKQNQLESLLQRRTCNDQVIQQLRMQISKLQNEEQGLKRQIQTIRLQRQEQQKQKQRLRLLVMQLKRQINQQEYHSQQFKSKITQVKQTNYLLKEELIALIRMQQKLQDQLSRISQQYQQIIHIQAESKKKIELLRDQLAVVEEDVKGLTQEYIRQGQIVREEERSNVYLNEEIDVVAKEAYEVWANIREIIAINNDRSEIKNKAFRIWMEIEELLAAE